MPRRYWLMKCEPAAYTIDDLARDGQTCWEGVRNYQARNFMRDEMRVGDRVLFLCVERRSFWCDRKSPTSRRRGTQITSRGRRGTSTLMLAAVRRRRSGSWSTSGSSSGSRTHSRWRP